MQESFLKQNSPPRVTISSSNFWESHVQATAPPVPEQGLRNAVFLGALSWQIWKTSSWFILKKEM